MNRRCRYPFGLLLLALSLVAASSVPAEPPPVFLLKWGTSCDTAVSGVDGCDGRTPSAYSDMAASRRRPSICTRMAGGWRVP